LKYVGWIEEILEFNYGVLNNVVAFVIGWNNLLYWSMASHLWISSPLFPI
jgi:hypothetical protein